MNVTAQAPGAKPRLDKREKPKSSLLTVEQKIKSSFVTPDLEPGTPNLVTEFKKQISQ